jgi:hypothetical protein
MTLEEAEIEFCEAFAAAHGIPALLDHLGLDGLGNQVNDLKARKRQEIVAEIAAWLRHIDRLDEIPGARLPLPQFNPLWDASFEIERRFA